MREKSSYTNTKSGGRTTSISTLAPSWVFNFTMALRFLRRKSSKITGEEKSNKNNAKVSSLAPIVDNESETSASSEKNADPSERRPSATETIDSSSTQDSKKKDGYMSRLAAESRESPHHSPWVTMSGMSHSGVKAAPPRAPKPKPRGFSPMSIQLSDPPLSRTSFETIPLSEAPAGDYHSGIGLAVDGGDARFSSSHTSIVIPPSPTITISPAGAPYNHRNSTTSMPSPPMPSYPPPAPPPVGVPIGTLANPFRDDPSPTDIGEPITNPHAVRPPPPPPPPAKLQRSPTKPSVPPPSAFSMNKRSASGRTSPGPSGFRKVSLPSPPVPPPPPPSAPPGDRSTTSVNDQGNSAFVDQPSSSNQSPPTSPSWDSWVPDLTGYYGGTPSFVAELDNTESPVAPGLAITSDDERQELDHTPDTLNDHLRVEEDLRETSKVLLPDGVSLRALTPEPGTNDTSSKSTENQIPPDSIVLSNSEHNSLLEELAKLRTQLADVDKLHKASQARIAEWEAYRVSMDKYVGQITADRQTIVEKLNSSEQAVAEKDRHTKQLHTSLNDWQAHAKAVEAHTQRVEADKAETVNQLTAQIDRLLGERTEADRSLQTMDEDMRRMQAAKAAELEVRTNAFEMKRAQMASQITHLEAQDRENQNRINGMDEDRRRLIAENTECKRTIEEWSRQYDTVASARNSSVKELQALKAQIVNMCSEADKAKARLEDAERTKVELAEAKEKMERMKETEQTMEKFVRTATEEKDKLRELLKVSTAARGRLGAALSEAEAQVKDREAKISALEKANEAQKKRMYMLGQRMAEKVEWWDGQVGAQRATAST
ncbi:hypothetical protein ABW21_db0205541 [Orbilia brochopaga]|nr:hypothetical protein ABW21_db0205541 [Drechslerella brochopaga]